MFLSASSRQYQPNYWNHSRGNKSICVLWKELWGHAFLCSNLQEAERGGGSQTVLSDSVGRRTLSRWRTGTAGSQAAEIHLQGWRKVTNSYSPPTNILGLKWEWVVLTMRVDSATIMVNCHCCITAVDIFLSVLMEIKQMRSSLFWTWLSLGVKGSWRFVTN